MFYSAGLSPSEFWACTMQEVELVYFGQLDRWRMERRNAYAIILASGNFKKTPSVFDILPLSYDEELGGGVMSEDEMVTLYKQYYPEYNA